MNSKRKLLLALSGLSAATVWEKPIIKAVVLPAHAQTSGCAIQVRLTAVVPSGGSVVAAFSITPRDINSDIDPISVPGTGISEHDFSVPFTRSYNLPPGVYGFSGGGGVLLTNPASNIKASFTMEVSCCNASAFAKVALNVSTNLPRRIIIGEDGNCEIICIPNDPALNRPGCP